MFPITTTTLVTVEWIPIWLGRAEIIPGATTQQAMTTNQVLFSLIIIIFSLCFRHVEGRFLLPPMAGGYGGGGYYPGGSPQAVYPSSGWNGAMMQPGGPIQPGGVYNGLYQGGYNTGGYNNMQPGMGGQNQWYPNTVGGGGVYQQPYNPYQSHQPMYPSQNQYPQQNPYGNQWSGYPSGGGMGRPPMSGQHGGGMYPQPGVPMPSGQSGGISTGGSVAKCGLRQTQSQYLGRKKRHLFYRLMQRQNDSGDGMSRLGLSPNQDDWEDTPRIVGGRVSDVRVKQSIFQNLNFGFNFFFANFP